MSQHDSSAASQSVFDKVAGKAKEVVGTVIGDDDLVEEGELQQRKAATAKQAVALTVEAEQREAEAELQRELTTNRVEQQRVAAQLAERTREQQLDRERAAAQNAVEREGTQREQALDRQRAAEERVLDIEETDVVADLVAGSAEAAEIEREAKQAKVAADALKSAQHQLEQS